MTTGMNIKGSDIPVPLEHTDIIVLPKTENNREKISSSAGHRYSWFLNYHDQYIPQSYRIVLVSIHACQGPLECYMRHVDIDYFEES